MQRWNCLLLELESQRFEEGGGVEESVQREVSLDCGRYLDQRIAANQAACSREGYDARVSTSYLQRCREAMM